MRRRETPTRLRVHFRINLRVPCVGRPTLTNKKQGRLLHLYALPRLLWRVLRRASDAAPTKSSKKGRLEQVRLTAAWALKLPELSKVGLAVLFLFVLVRELPGLLLRQRVFIFWFWLWFVCGLCLVHGGLLFHETKRNCPLARGWGTIRLGFMKRCPEPKENAHRRLSQWTSDRLSSFLSRCVTIKGNSFGVTHLLSYPVGSRSDDVEQCHLVLRKEA